MSSREQLQQAYGDWIKALNDRNLDAIASLVASTVIDEEQEVSRDQYVQRVAGILESSAVDKIEIDFLTIDTGARAIAARLVHRSTLSKPYLRVPVTGKPVEWIEYPITWFDTDGKIASVKNLIDIEALRAGKAEAPRTPDLQYGPPPPGFDIPTMYHSYIDSINAQTTKESLPNLVLPVVTHNLQVSTIDGYRAFIDDSFVKVEGFKLTLTHLLTDEVSQQVASRIELSGKPIDKFMGSEPTGRAMRFPEHAYYKLDGGKIAYVWAMRDLETYKKSLAGEE